jgi:tellurite resistance protein TehA-like permease
MNSLSPTLTSLRYLSKVVLALALLGAVVLMSLDSGLAASLGLPSFVIDLACLLVMLALAPWVFHVYKGMDELHRHLHQAASAISLPLLASVIGAVGVLQARGYLPLFNQFWSLGGLLVLWGIALMQSDRRLR